MATKLHLYNDLALPFLGVPPQPPGLHTKPNAGAQFWDGDSRGYMNVGLGGGLVPQTIPEFALETVTSRTISGLTAIVFGNSASAGTTITCCVSPPVAHDFTLSGTVTFNYWANESGSTVGARILVRLYRLKPDGTLTAIVTDSAHASELPTTIAAQNWTATPTSTAMEKGDRLVLFTGLGQINDAWTTLTSAVTVTHGDDVGGATGDTWIQLTENVTFQDDAPAGTTLYLIDDVSDVDTESGFTKREMWTTTGASATTAVVNTAAGPRTFRTDQYTVTAGGDKIEWFSKPLEGTTLVGPVNVRLWCIQNGGFGTTCVAEIAKVDEDGTGAVLWSAAELARGESPTTWSMETSREPYEGWLSGQDMAIAGGQRLRFRVYFDDAYHFGDDNASPAGQTCTLHFNGNVNTGTGSGNQSQLTFSQTLTEWAGPPGPVTDPYLVVPARVF